MHKVLRRSERTFAKVEELGPDVRLEVAVHAGEADGAVMTSGLTRLTDSAFDWDFSVNEVLYMVEGELVVCTADGELRLAQGDMAYFSQGEAVRLSAAGEALYLWVTYPTE